MQKLRSGFGKYLACFPADYAFLQREHLFKERIGFPIYQVHRHIVFIENQFFLHIEYGHVVYQVLIRNHHLQFVLLQLLQFLQVTETVLKKQGKQDETYNGSYNEITI